MDGKEFEQLKEIMEDELSENEYPSFYDGGYNNEQNSLIYKQNEELLILLAKQQELLNNIGHVINLHSTVLNEMNQKFNGLVNKLSDMEINSNLIDSSLNDMSQEHGNLSNQIEDLKHSVDNIKIYKMVD